MKELLSILLAVTSGVLVSEPLPLDKVKECKAWIDIESDNSRLKIEAFCQSQEDCHLMYKLVAKKSGESGKAKTFQSGYVYLRSQEKKCLSRLYLGVSPKDEYEIRLEVYKNGELIATDSVIHPQKKGDKYVF